MANAEESILVQVEGRKGTREDKSFQSVNDGGNPNNGNVSL